MLIDKLHQSIEHLYGAYHRNRKTMNENIGIIVSLFGLLISLLAVIAAFWSGVEAHKARVSADELGRQSVKAATRAADEQHRSVQAQIDQMQLSARPFVKITSNAYQREGDKYYLRVNMTAVGQTPAFNVKLKMKCAVDVDESRALTFLEQARAGGSDQTIDAAAELDNGEATFGGCNTDESSFLSGVQFLQVGEIAYDDFFKVRHTTTFCLQAGIGDSEQSGHLTRCRHFVPEVT